MRRLFFVVSVLLVLAVLSRRFGLALGPEHRLRAPSAVLGPELLAAFDARTEPDPVEAALAETDDLLHFGLGHATSLRFDAPREGNCVEYAVLFATLFERAARARGVDGQAWPVRSAPATIWGVAIPHPAFRDHDWALVRIGHTLRFVDPLFHDLWLDSDVGTNVRDPAHTLATPVRSLRDGTKRRNAR